MKNKYQLAFLGGLILVSTLLIFGKKSDTEKEGVKKNASEFYEVKALKVPKNLNFSGELIPIGKLDVKERIDRELLVNTYWQSNALLLFKRANKYFPIIEPILEKNGIPNDFKYLAITESGLQNVVSPAGATGFWQILRGTAKEYGLEVNKNVDERYHIEKSTEVACMYLKKAKKKFGSWTLAAASYNAGMGRISKLIKRQQVQNYYDLFLVSETSRYLPRIIAIKEILSHPIKYGFVFENEDLYTLPNYRNVKVDSAITNLAVFAKEMNINYKILKNNNPWLRGTNLINKTRKEYVLKIPEL